MERAFGISISCFFLTLFLIICQNVSLSEMGTHLDLHCDLNDTNYNVFRDNTIDIIDLNEKRMRVRFLYTTSIRGHPYCYNFTDDAGEVLKKKCMQNVTPVLNYIRQNNFPASICEFYPAGYKVKGEIKKIGNWNLKCESFNFPRERAIKKIVGILISSIIIGLILVPIVIPFALVIFLILYPMAFPVLIGVILISVYLAKKQRVSPLYLRPLFFGVLVGIEGYYQSTDKKIGKRLIIVGAAVSLAACILSLFMFEYLLIGWRGDLYESMTILIATFTY